MSTELTDTTKTPMDNFKSALSAKIAKEAGTLMPDDVMQQLISESLTSLIKEGMQESGYQTKKGWIRSEIESTIIAQVRGHVTEILKDEDVLQEAVKEIFSNVLPTMLMRIINDNMQWSLETKIKEMFQNNQTY